MSDFFVNFNDSVFQPFLNAASKKVEEFHENEKVDLTTVQNIAVKHGVSEEDYAKGEEAFWGIAQEVLSVVAPVANQMAPVVDTVFNAFLEALGSSNLSATSQKTTVENNTNETTEETSADEKIEEKTSESNVFIKNDDRIKYNDDGSAYVVVEPWSNDSSANNCLERIVANSYDLNAMGIEKNSPEYYALLEKVMDANPDIYGTKDGGWRSEVGGTGRVNAVIRDGEKINLPDVENANKTDNNANVEESNETGKIVDSEEKEPVGNSNNTLLSETQLNDKICTLEAQIELGDKEKFEEIWNSMTPEQQAQVMEEFDGDLLAEISKMPISPIEKQVFLDSISSNIAKTENGPEILAKELNYLLKSDEVSDFAAINSVLKNDAISSEDSLEIMKAYDKIVNPNSDPEGLSLIDDICDSKNLLSGDKLEILCALSKDIEDQSVATGNSYATEKDKIAKAIDFVDDIIQSI